MADLKLVIGGDSRGAQDALRAVGDEIRGVSAVTKIGGAALGALAGSVGAMTLAVINAQDEISKLSTRTGIAVETLSALKVGGELADVSLDALATGARTLAKTIIDADRGSVTAQRTLERLGVSSRDAAGELTTVEAGLRTAADALAGMESATERAALAQEAFGRGGLELLPILVEGSEGLDRMTERARALGLAMNEDGTAQAERFNDALTGLTQTLTGTVQTAVDFWLPALARTAESVEFVVGLLTGRGEAAWERQRGAVERAVDPLDDMDAALAEAGAEIDLWVAANGRVVEATDASAASTVSATSATRDRASATAELARAQEEQARFEAEMLAGIIGGIAEQQAQDDRRHAYEMEREVERVARLADLEADLAAERLLIREQSAADAERLRGAEMSAAQSVFSGIGQLADLAYGIVGDSAEAGAGRAKGAMKALFVASKAAALAGAVVNTASAVTNALATPPFPVGAALAVGAGIAGAAEIATIVATTIQGIADAGRMPGVDALRAAGLNRHSLIAVRHDEAVVDPNGTRDLSAMLSIQRRQMEIGTQRSGVGPVVVVAEIDGRRMTRGLSPHMAQALDDGYDYRLSAMRPAVA